MVLQVEKHGIIYATDNILHQLQVILEQTEFFN